MAAAEPLGVLVGGDVAPEAFPLGSGLLLEGEKSLAELMVKANVGIGYAFASGIQQGNSKPKIRIKIRPGIGCRS